MDLQRNPQLELAFDYVLHTHKNVFLTGKAGTGKTTFLRQLRQESIKRMVVVASTGVAAINAGGMTIHSFFQLPFGPYIPGASEDPSRMRQFTREKINLIKSLDLLVIDEISMVRADVLDGIDEVLRRYRNRNRPFGGVQLLMIGDLHQLPPVVKDEEWNLLREHYNTAYFFGSLALKQTETVRIELKHIYRQSDQQFIELLNRVRDNQLDETVLNLLNSRYIPNFRPAEEDAYITLTSHNQAAKDLNTGKLEQLPGKSYVYRAIVTGEFPHYAYPTDEELELKVEAQVMFVKNDLSQEKRYYNGKIGKITRIQDEVIYVLCPDEKLEIEVRPDEWQNIKYTLDETSKEVRENIVGTFKQYPLKLAWAITIHKSQGLTFERAIIDAQSAFAHGQVYVALSRCKSFEGIVLHSKIAHSSVRTDAVVRNYSAEADRYAPDEQHLQQSKTEYQQGLILEQFDFGTAKRLLEQAKRVLLGHERSLNPESVAAMLDLEQGIRNQIILISDKFKPQLQGYFQADAFPEEHPDLQQRIQKASTYFEEQLGNIYLPQLKQIQVVTDNKTIEKQAADTLNALEKELYIKRACFLLSKSGFRAQEYLKTKANAEIDFLKAPAKSASQKKMSAAFHTSHPELYHRLYRWRENLAADLDIEPYQIMPQKILLQVVETLPATSAALKKIKGIGAAKLKQFGQVLLQLIQQYVEEFNLQETQLLIPDLEEWTKPPQNDTKTISYNLYKAGKTVEEIALERQLSPTTIEGHLAHFVGTGHLPVEDFVPVEKLQVILAHFQHSTSDLLGEAKAQLGDDYTYLEIRMTKKYLENIHKGA